MPRLREPHLANTRGWCADEPRVRRGQAKNVRSLASLANWRDALTAHHLTYATRNRTARKFVFALQRIARCYPKAKRIHLVMDNLNTHREKSLTDTFGKRRG